MTDLERLWASKSDEQLNEAAGSIGDYTPQGRRAIRDELARRGMPQPPLEPEAPVRVEQLAPKKKQCTSCGSTAPTEQRYVAASLTSQRLKSTVAGYLPTTITEDAKVWDLALCSPCLGASYKLFAHNERKRILGHLRWTGLTVVLGPFSLLVLSSRSAANMVTGTVSALVATFTLVLSIGAVILLPFTLFRFFKMSRAASGSAESTSMLPNSLADAFRGEAERIYAELRTGDAKKVYGQFPLPQPQTMSIDHVDKMTFHADYVEQSLETLDDRLPVELKDLLRK